jgi:hypothetical protein
MDPIEELKQHPYISDHVTLQIFEEPYKHIIIDNLLKPEIYAKLCKKFSEIILKEVKPVGQIGTSPEHIYDALIHTMTNEECLDGLEFFADPFWKNYLSNIFNIIFNPHTAYSLHYHKASKEKRSKDGWAHKDLSICSVINNNSKEVRLTSGCEYADDTHDYPHTLKVIRSVANLFYLNNIDNPKEENGGGTGVYPNYEKEPLIKTIFPINNRLFAFEVSPISYHSFIGADFNRSAIVQWFHSSPSYYVHKHLDKFKKQFKDEDMIFEPWKDKNLWRLEDDPDYRKYFNKPFVEILNS